MGPLKLHRRTLLLGLAAAPLLSARAEIAAPVLQRIKIVTVGAPNIETFVEWYSALGFAVAERGRVPADLARSWGAPNTVKKKYVLMPAGSPDFFVRAVETDAVPGYRASTTTGWNAFEFVVQDVQATFERVKASPFQIIAPPKSLGGQYSSIVAMQAKGPAEEVIYLTMDTGDPTKSALPKAQSAIDRVFIAIVAGRSMQEMEAFYRETFGLTQGTSFDMPVVNLARPLGLPDSHVFPLLLRRAGAPGNNIELDGYPTSAHDRPRANGQLPPGNAMVSFTVPTLDTIVAPFAGPAVTHAGLGYSKRRSATAIGAAGELIELIEE